jgi:hypothetical protein
MRLGLGRRRRDLSVFETKHARTRAHTRVHTQLGPGLMLEYKHALNEPSDFKLAVLDCLRGVKRALEMSWLDVKKFDFDKYQLLGDPRQFDLHQVSFRGHTFASMCVISPNPKTQNPKRADFSEW